MENEKISLAHGAGGELSRLLMESVILPEFGNDFLQQMHDGAVLTLGPNIAFTTDSFVVAPRFFPGGDIGKLAVCGTVNDLAVTGAVPRYISCSLILEEGLEMEELRRVLRSMRLAADEAGVAIVTGDTKVVGKGAVDGVYINTAGLGEIEGEAMAPQRVRPGMDVVLSGTLGDHAATVMAERHGIEIPQSLQSDCAPLGALASAMRRAAPSLACMRDATRGGAAAVLNEIAAAAKVGIIIEEEALPVREEVEGIAAFLGFDPLELANEGKIIAFCAPEDTEAVLSAMRRERYGENACCIGRTTAEEPGIVAMETAFGGLRIVDMPSGAIVPRIC
ncbi:hydrogenase expression/formation protein HypE [Selenomonas sputigena]|uniref:Hydrogenase expression/formation protein HypE n=1 Tax=Selenomonas sputigena TaxID=69823 RepID=A0ABV3X6W4_9FIRM